jgi:glycosyltransferase involved in cell wall biosynthesis
MVGTFHASTPKMRAIASVSPLIEPMIEKLSARIAVSEMAQETLKNLYGTEAVVIPNGIDCARFGRARHLEIRKAPTGLKRLEKVFQFCLKRSRRSYEPYLEWN